MPRPSIKMHWRPPDFRFLSQIEKMANAFFNMSRSCLIHYLLALSLCPQFQGKGTSSPLRSSTAMVEYFLWRLMPWSLVIIFPSSFVWGRKRNRVPWWLCVVFMPLSSIIKACYLIGTGAVGSRPNLSKWSRKRHRTVIGHLLPFPFDSRVWIRVVYSHQLRVTKHNGSKITL